MSEVTDVMKKFAEQEAGTKFKPEVIIRILQLNARGPRGSKDLTWGGITTQLRRDYGAEHGFSKRQIERTVNAWEEFQTQYKPEEAAVPLERESFRDLDVVKNFIALRRRLGKDERTLQATIYENEHVFKFLRRKSPDSWDKDDLEAYIKARIEGTITGHAIGLEDIGTQMKQIRSFTRFLGKEQSINKAPDSPLVPLRWHKDAPALSADWLTVLKVITDVEQADDSMLSERQRDDLSFTIYTKVVTMMRTGNRKDNRELWGLKRGHFRSKETWVDVPDTSLKAPEAFHVTANPTGDPSVVFPFHVFAKKDEQWGTDVPTGVWLTPSDYNLRLIAHIDKYHIPLGGYLIEDSEPKRLVAAFRHYGGEYFPAYKTMVNPLHSLRGTGLNMLQDSGIRFEDAVRINVGWKDLSTAFTYYSRKGLRATEFYPTYINHFFPTSSMIVGTPLQTGALIRTPSEEATS